MRMHDLVRRVPSERLRQWLLVTLRETSDPVPRWLGPSQVAAAVVLFSGFPGLLLLPSERDLWSGLIGLGAAASLALRLLSLRWAPALRTGPWPRALGSGSLVVTLTGAGEAPVRVVKAVREISGATLAASRQAVVTAPTVLLVEADEQAATRAADVLCTAGAEVTVEPGATATPAVEV
ncbi:MAG TPA: ribosomal protein L7/L12 [Kineosporiaceae bacterium]|nr:ribosomal protein L7/L12 [Kineosporiaceae bacterium]